MDVPAFAFLGVKLPLVPRERITLWTTSPNNKCYLCICSLEPDFKEKILLAHITACSFQLVYFIGRPVTAKARGLYGKRNEASTLVYPTKYSQLTYIETQPSKDKL